MSTASWRAALRLARRGARRAKGRAALVIVLLALPVALLTFIGVMYDTFTPTRAEAADRTIGAADAAVQLAHTGPIMQTPDGEIRFPAGGSGTEERAHTAADVQRLLPAGSRMILNRAESVTVATPNGVARLSARSVDYADPLARGILRQVDGRAPAASDEVALTERAARRAGVRIGDRIRTVSPDRELRVVGIVEYPDDLRAETVVARPGTLSDAAQPQASDWWLVATPRPVAWSDVVALNDRGMTVKSRTVLVDPPPNDAVPLFNSDRFGYEEGSANDILGIGLVVALALLEVVLLAGPAFAVGARRRERELALVAANGGTPAHIRRMVLADGVVLGTLGAAAGLLLGVGVAAAGLPLAETISGQRIASFGVFPRFTVLVAGFAVLAGLLAAMVPAWTAARREVVAALSGRRGITRSRRRYVILGLSMAGAGGTLALFGASGSDIVSLVAGLILVEVGLVLCTPALVGAIAKLGRFLPLSPRIALRDAGRNRASAAPAVAAIMAAVAGTVAVGVVFATTDAYERKRYIQMMPMGTAAVGLSEKNSSSDPAGLDALTRALTETMPVRRTHVVHSPECPPGAGKFCGLLPLLPKALRCPLQDIDQRPPTEAERRAAERDERCQRNSGGWGKFYMPLAVVADDPAILGLLTGASGPDVDRATAVLRSGGVVVTDRSFLIDGQVTIAAISEGGTRQELTVPGAALASPWTQESRGRIFAPRSLVERLGMRTNVAAVLAETTRMPTQAEEERLNALLQGLGGGSGYVERGDQLGGNVPLIVLSVIAGLITLGAAGIATGLAAAEGRADLSTLAAVGASPRLRRRLAVSQSGVIAGLGTLLGIAAGAATVAAILYAVNHPREPGEDAGGYELVLPWSTLGVGLIAVPLIAMLGAGLFVRSRLPIERRLT